MVSLLEFDQEQRLSQVESLYYRENTVVSDPRSSRAQAIEQLAAVMREFMARAVLFQDAVARSGGLNATDLQAVGLLLNHGPATPGELAAEMGITAGGAVTAVIDRLEKAGYVSRARDSEDRRRVIITANQQTVLERVGQTYGRIGARWTDYLQTLTDEQLAFAHELFTQATQINRDETTRLKDLS